MSEAENLTSLILETGNTLLISLYANPALVCGPTTGAEWLRSIRWTDRVDAFE